MTPLPNLEIYLGRMTIAYSYFEHNLSILYETLAGVDRGDAAITFANLGLRNKIDIIKSIGEYKLAGSPAAHELKNFISKAKGLSTERNAIVHGCILENDSGEIAVRKMNNYGKLKIHSEIKSIEDFARIANEITVHVNQIIPLSKKIEAAVNKRRKTISKNDVTDTPTESRLGMYQPK